MHVAPLGTNALGGSDQRASAWPVRVSVVIPTLNEASNLPYVLPRIPWWVDEVLLVDGRSTDGTVETARRLLPRVRIVEEKKKGKGAALRTGVRAATGDIIVTLDADGSMDPKEIPAFVGALLAGADYAKGSRFLQGGGTRDMGPFRFFGNFGFRVLVRTFFGGQFSDLCYGYNAFWKDLVPLLMLDGDGFEIETMMNISALVLGVKIAEVPSFEDARIYGQSRLRSLPDGWRMLRTILRARARANPLSHRSRGSGSRLRAGHRADGHAPFVVVAPFEPVPARDDPTGRGTPLTG